MAAAAGIERIENFIFIPSVGLVLKGLLTNNACRFEKG
jgi:hypothetical protein